MLCFLAHWVQNNLKEQIKSSNDDEKVIISKPVSGKTIYLRLYLDGISMKYSYAYSTDNKTFTPIGDIFEMNFGYWQVLPFNPVDKANSPYCSASAFACSAGSSIGKAYIRQYSATTPKIREEKHILTGQDMKSLTIKSTQST